MDEENPEDIDHDQESHVYDEACHIIMARAYGHSVKDIQQIVETKVQAERRAAIPKSNQEVWSELDRMREQLDQDERY